MLRGSVQIRRVVVLWEVSGGVQIFLWTGAVLRGSVWHGVRMPNTTGLGALSEDTEDGPVYLLDEPPKYDNNWAAEARKRYEKGHYLKAAVAALISMAIGSTNQNFRQGQAFRSRSNGNGQ